MSWKYKQSRAAYNIKEKDFESFLNAKRLIDSRALNKDVLNKALDYMNIITNDTLKILEIGSGNGAQTKRIIIRLKHPNVEYTVSDIDSKILQNAKEKLFLWAVEREYNVLMIDDSNLVFEKENCKVKLFFRQLDVEKMDSDTTIKNNFDVLIAHAFLDQTPIRESVPKVLSAIRRGGVFYSSMNYNGGTNIYPNHKLDKEVINVYHDEMRKKISLDEKCPFHSANLIETVANQEDVKFIKSGSSNWIIKPKSDNSDVRDYIFLKSILKTIESISSDFYTKTKIEQWLKERYRQLENGDLEMKVSLKDYIGIVK